MQITENETLDNSNTKSMTVKWQQKAFVTNSFCKAYIKNYTLEGPD